MSLIIPDGYKSHLSIHDTEVAIKVAKDFFEKSLSTHLNLTRVSAPLMVIPKTGLNDNLNGVERPVGFDLGGGDGRDVEIVQSLAKWKRHALKRYGFEHGTGLYADMSAIRRDEFTDNIHSIYVDQWDWERVINADERNEKYLKYIVQLVYDSLLETEDYISIKYDYIKKTLPSEITFITTSELEEKYPNLTPKEREYEATKEHGAIFLMQIGGDLKSGKPHDGRSPDYDDWTLNGDIIVYYDVLDIALELSSMGIRVDEKAMVEQLKKAGCEDRMDLPFVQDVINKRVPLTIGGGIGQSRICMFYLKKAHIGEVQSSIWTEDDMEELDRLGMQIL